MGLKSLQSLSRISEWTSSRQRRVQKRSLECSSATGPAKSKFKRRERNPKQTEKKENEKKSDRLHNFTISAEWKPQLIIIIIEEIEKSKIRKRAKSKASGASGDFHPRRPAIWTNAWLTKRTPEWGCRGLLEGYRACVLLARQLALCTGSSTFFNEVCLWISPSHA